MERIVDKPLRIWIVDDDMIYRFTARCFLEQWQPTSTIEEFAEGTSALARVRQVSNDPELLPDIILVDIYMPELDGWELLAELEPLREQLPKPIRIFIVTGSLDEQLKLSVHKTTKVNGLLLKPIVLMDFEALVMPSAA